MIKTMDWPRPVTQEVLDPSWSETTTPSNDGIEEIVRSPVRRSGDNNHSRPRYFRPPIRRRVRLESFNYQANGAASPQNYEFPILDSTWTFDGSETSAASSQSPVASATSSWSSTGFVDEDRDAIWEEEEGDKDAFWEEDDEVLLVPKLEVGEDDVDMADMRENESVPDTPPIAFAPVITKRPRGRPRKHPKPSPEAKAKVTKGRSKTGCLTCRKRKKKCDERKPGCLNCQKNNKICEGYPSKTPWKSGKETQESGTTIIWVCQPGMNGVIPSSTKSPINIPAMTLAPAITGVTTTSDFMFLEHYIQRLSPVFTPEGGEENNAFRKILLPMAMHNQGLMHSILALSGSHIDYDSSYGIQFLKDHPDVNIRTLEDRRQFHCDEAMRQLQEHRADENNAIDPATLGQMLCLVLQTMSDPNPTGMHRLHLQSYQSILKENSLKHNAPEDDEFLTFVDEFFQYNIHADELISLPQFSEGSRSRSSDDWELSSAAQPSSARLIGVRDGLFFHMSRITKLRNSIRENLQNGVTPPVNFQHIHRCSAISQDIVAWKASWPAGYSLELTGILYQQMISIYLFRTMHPPSRTNWKIQPELTQAVDEAILLLKQVGSRQPNQTLTLIATFVLGCAAFEPEQRTEIRKAIENIKQWTRFKNPDSALKLLQEVWRLMDAKDPRSWDWQTTANEMGTDFLVT